MTTKTIARYLADLRLDLKDSGSLWSDAELVRCVDHAVADYSRFNPREMSREITVDAEVTSESVTTPAVSDTDYFVTTLDLVNTIVDGEILTIVSGHRKPDVPRPVIMTLTDDDASITRFTLIVKGYDQDNKYVEETFYLIGGLVQTGVQYFALVSEIEIDEISGNVTGDTLIVGTGAADGVYVQLANKPIKFQSEAISGSELDTDYEMDYYDGRIAMKSGGNMTVSTAYSINYTKSRIEIDLSAIIEDIIKVERVEYPVGQVPQRFSVPEVWGTVMTLTGSHESQAEVSDAEHMVIRYLAEHSSPSTQSRGSYASYLDSTIQVAASAYALFMMALKYKHQAVTDLASARTAMSNLAASHTLATAALAKAILYLSTNTYGGTGENAVYWLTKITADTSDLRVGIGTALDAANSQADTGITSSVVAAIGFLTTGDDYINTLNDGARVPENFREYSQARSEITNTRLLAVGAYIQEAAARIANINTYIAQAMEGWAKIAEDFIQEASGHFYNMDRYLQEATSYHQSAAYCMQLADAFKNEGIERRNEVWAIWSTSGQIAPNYVLGQRGQAAS